MGRLRAALFISGRWAALLAVLFVQKARAAPGAGLIALNGGFALSAPRLAALLAAGGGGSRGFAMMGASTKAWRWTIWFISASAAMPGLARAINPPRQHAEIGRREELGRRRWQT